MLSEIFRRVRYWLAKDKGYADLEDEMRLHVALRAEKLRASGMEHTEADVVARRRFGNVGLILEDTRAVWQLSLIHI